MSGESQNSRGRCYQSGLTCSPIGTYCQYENDISKCLSESQYRNSIAPAKPSKFVPISGLGFDEKSGGSNYKLKRNIRKRNTHKRNTRKRNTHKRNTHKRKTHKRNTWKRNIRKINKHRTKKRR